MHQNLREHVRVLDASEISAVIYVILQVHVGIQRYMFPIAPPVVRDRVSRYAEYPCREFRYRAMLVPTYCPQRLHEYLICQVVGENPVVGAIRDEPMNSRGEFSVHLSERVPVQPGRASNDFVEIV
jgi:hypothetical protein